MSLNNIRYTKFLWRLHRIKRFLSDKWVYRKTVKWTQML